VADDPEKALETMAEDQRNLHAGLEAEVKQDLDKAKGEGRALGNEAPMVITPRALLDLVRRLRRRK
jgi:hypothetical protein